MTQRIDSANSDNFADLSKEAINPPARPISRPRSRSAPSSTPSSTTRPGPYLELPHPSQSFHSSLHSTRADDYDETLLRGSASNTNLTPKLSSSSLSELADRLQVASHTGVAQDFKNIPIKQLAKLTLCFMHHCDGSHDRAEEKYNSFRESVRNMPSYEDYLATQLQKLRRGSHEASGKLIRELELLGEEAGKHSMLGLVREVRPRLLAELDLNTGNRLEALEHELERMRNINTPSWQDCSQEKLYQLISRATMHQDRIVLLVNGEPRTRSGSGRGSDLDAA